MSSRVAKKNQAGGANEDYPTPAWCVHALLHEPQFSPGGPIFPSNGSYLEPCAGSGSIISAARNLGTWHAVEIDEANEKPLRTLAKTLQATQENDKPPPLRIDMRDFFDMNLLAEKADAGSHIARNCWRYQYDAVITNPPYSLAYEFVNRCRELAPIVAMLLRVNFLESAERAPWFHKLMPEYVRVLPDRPRFRNGSADSSAYAWMIWTPWSGSETKSVRVLDITPKNTRAHQERWDDFRDLNREKNRVRKQRRQEQ